MWVVALGDIICSWFCPSHPPPLPPPPPPLDLVAGINYLCFCSFYQTARGFPKHLEQLMELAGVECNTEGGNKVMETEAPCWISAQE